MKELITVKEYCKREKITDAGARKRVSQKLINSVILDNITYIIIDSDCKNKIIVLQQKSRLQREQISKLKQEQKFYINQDKEILELKEDIKSLRADLKEHQERERSLYEKVIVQYDRLLPR